MDGEDSGAAIDATTALDAATLDATTLDAAALDAAALDAPPVEPEDASRPNDASALDAPMTAVDAGPSACDEIPTLTPLGAAEVAARLSQFLWREPPDATLLAAPLSTGAEVVVQARRMFNDMRARAGVAAFFRGWLPSPSAGSDPLLVDLVSETDRFVQEVVFERDARFETLMTGNFTFLNRRLAVYYRVAGTFLDWTLVDLPQDQRAGILTHASVLVAPFEDPVARGVRVREQLLCGDVPPPPPGVDITPPMPDPGETRREAYVRVIGSQPACGSCHRLVDPIGYGFEHFDTSGRYRSTDSGHPVDATGEVISSGDAAGTFNGARELATRLATSREGTLCFTRKVLAHALGRALRTTDACSIEQAHNAFTSTSGDITALMVAITGTESFRSE